MSDIAIGTVEAANQATFHVEHCGTEEPLACGDDYMVEFLDLGCPRLVKFVEVEIEGAGNVIRICFLGLYQIG